LIGDDRPGCGLLTARARPEEQYAPGEAGHPTARSALREPSPRPRQRSIVQKHALLKLADVRVPFQLPPEPETIQTGVRRLSDNCLVYRRDSGGHIRYGDGPLLRTESEFPAREHLHSRDSDALDGLIFRLVFGLGIVKMDRVESPKRLSENRSCQC
jgi:hypothetical protein